MTIRTAGELRGFLAEVLQGIRSGSVDVEEAQAIAKVAAQINQSLAVEVSVAIRLQNLGRDQPPAGSMLIASGPAAMVVTNTESRWCEQCENTVSAADADKCKSPHCKAKAKAA